MDIYWWLERIGNFDTTIDQIPDPDRARREPSAQLVGRPDGRSLDLSTLQDAGVRVSGRVTGIDGHRVAFADDLAGTAAVADRRMRRVLAAIDRHIDDEGLSSEVLAPEPVPEPRPGAWPDRLDLRANGIRTVIWATGHRRSYPWLRVPVLDSAGEIRQRLGVTPSLGLYVLGQRFQHFRSSNFIDGVGRDATFIADQLTRRRVPATCH
jgi:putative flavoprotein involved in K+ transport